MCAAICAEYFVISEEVSVTAVAELWEESIR